MRILNIVLDGRIAGAQIRIAEVAKVLKDNFKIETVVLFPEKNSDNFKNLLDKYEIEWHTEKLHKLSKNLVNMVIYSVLFPVEVWKIKKVIIKKNIDIVYCNGSWQWKGVIAGKLAGEKVVWHLNDTKIPFFVRIVFKILARRVDGLIVSGKKVKEYYLKNFNINKPVVKIEPPVNINKYDPERVDPDPALSKYKGTKIVSICNVNYYKGIEYLIEAAEILNKTFLNIDFIIVGNLFKTQKKYINSLKKKISDKNIKNFYFYGPSENIPSILKASDIFVCSSIAEAGPMSVWEAMAMKKPIVSTDVGSVSEFIKDRKNGFIVNIKDSNSLAEKIGILIDNKEKWMVFGENARIVAEKELDVKILAEKHFEIYQKICNGKK